MLPVYSEARQERKIQEADGPLAVPPQRGGHHAPCRRLPASAYLHYTYAQARALRSLPRR